MSASNSRKLSTQNYRCGWIWTVISVLTQWSQILHTSMWPGDIFFFLASTLTEALRFIDWKSSLLTELSDSPTKGSMNIKAHIHTMLEGLIELRGLQNFPGPSPHRLFLPILQYGKAGTPWNHIALLLPLTLPDWQSALETKGTGGPIHSTEPLRHSRGLASNLYFPPDFILCPLLSPCEPWPPLLTL